jgi:hypothetical protein
MCTPRMVWEYSYKGLKLGPVLGQLRSLASSHRTWFGTRSASTEPMVMIDAGSLPVAAASSSHGR